MNRAPSVGEYQAESEGVGTTFSSDLIGSSEYRPGRTLGA